jgi:hypothetical protein
MNRIVHACAMSVAFVATCYGGLALLVGFEADFEVAAIIAVLALGTVFVTDYVAHERERMAHMREADWRKEIEELDDWERDDSDNLREVD